jgi:serine/threonine-protein kinase
LVREYRRFAATSARGLVYAESAMAGIDEQTNRGDPRPQRLPRGLVGGRGEAAPPPDDESVDPWPGRVFDGRFEILERIGRGGMATVYRAREAGLIRREVAIKLLSRECSQNPAIVARFRHEAQLIADIHHPHVVQLLHVGQAHGQLYLVMELLRGESLQATLKRGRTLPWERLAQIALQVCAALQAAHTRKIIHRDIKPSNVFREDAAGRPDFIKLLDFGIAKAELAVGGDGPLTQQGVLIGTPHYAAPEIVEPSLRLPVDGRVDMYALGVMLYQCLCGELPFAGATRVEVLHDTVHRRPPPLRERVHGRPLPADVEALVARAMALDPDDRYADMSELAAAIRETTSPRPRNPTAIAGTIVDSSPRPRSAWRLPAHPLPPRPTDPARTPPPPPRPSLDATALADDLPTPKPSPRTPPPHDTRKLAETSFTSASEPDSASTHPNLVAEPEQPTPYPAVAAGPAPPAGNRHVVATLAVMAVGMLGLLLLFARELWSPEPDPPPPTSDAPAPDPAPPTSAPLSPHPAPEAPAPSPGPSPPPVAEAPLPDPPPRPVAEAPLPDPPPRPAAEASAPAAEPPSRTAADASALLPAPPATPTPDPPPSVDPHDPTVARSEDPTQDAPARRRRRIERALDGLPLTEFFVTCGITLGDVAWALPIRLTIAADGHVRDLEDLSRSRSTLSRDERSCLLEQVRMQRFARGDAELAIPFTLRPRT